MIETFKENVADPYDDWLVDLIKKSNKNFITIAVETRFQHYLFFKQKDSLMEEELVEFVIPKKDILPINNNSAHIKTNNEAETKLKEETVKNDIPNKKEDELLKISSTNKSYFCIIT